MGEAFAGWVALLVLANVAGWIARRLHLPDLLGFVAAGLLLGPTAVGVASPAEAGTDVRLFWRVISDLGLAALMIGAGLAVPRRLPPGNARHTATFAVAIVACLVPAYLTAPLLMSGDPVADSGEGHALAYRMALALGVIVTSVPFLVKILKNTGLLATSFGGASLRTACVVDIVVWTLFPLAAAVAAARAPDGLESGLGHLLLRPAAAVALFAAVLTLASAYERRMRRATRPSSAGRLIYVLAIATICAAVAWGLGVGLMLGALAFGLGLAPLQHEGREPRDALSRLLSGVLVPGYFAVVGLSIDLNRDLVMNLVVGFLLWSSLIKMSGVAATAVLLRMPWSQAAAFALALNTRGGPGIALAGLALGAGVVGEPTFVALVVASLATSWLAEAGLGRLQAHARRWDGERPRAQVARPGLAR